MVGSIGDLTTRRMSRAGSTRRFPGRWVGALGKRETKRKGLSRFSFRCPYVNTMPNWRFACIRTSDAQRRR